MDNKACVICRKGEEEERLSTVTNGLQSLIQSSQVLNLEQLYNNLKNAETSNEAVVYIYSTCTKNIQNAVRTKERAAKRGHKTDTSTKPKILLEGPVVSLIGKCTALYVVKNAKIKKHCQLN